MKYSLILEGPDCIGKTTLANKITEKLKRVETLHGIPCKSLAQVATWTENYSTYLKFNALAQRYTLADRICTISEMVYGQDAVSQEILCGLIRSRLEDHSVIVIFTVEDVQWLIDRCDDRGDEFITAEDLNWINEGYLSAAKTLVDMNITILWIHYKTKEELDNNEEVVNRILEEMGVLYDEKR